MPTQIMNYKKIKNRLLEIYSDLLIENQKETKKLKQLIKLLTKDNKI